MAQIGITNEKVEAPISIERAPTEFARRGIQTVLIFSDLIRGRLVFGLGSAKGIRLGCEIFLQNSTMSVNTSRNVTINITS